MLPVPSTAAQRAIARTCMLNAAALALSAMVASTAWGGKSALSTGSVPLALPADVQTPAFGEGLRSHAGRIDIGMQVGGDEIYYIPGDGRLLPAIHREANVLLIGNSLKWAEAGGPNAPILRPSRDTYDFSAGDLLVAWAHTRGMKVRAHTLVWGNALPAWLTSGNFTRDELLQILQEHIQTVVGRYKGRVHIWDVVNEAIEWNGQYKDTFWYRNLGPEYIELAFRWAHEADPSALLFVNEDGSEGLGSGSDLFLQKIKALLDKKVPIHGVGLETHVDLNYRTLGGNADASPAPLSANIQRLGALGLQVHLSEVDVRIPTPATPEGLQAQAQVYANLYNACAAQPACTGFFTWGLTDRWSWISRSFAGLGTALLLDENYAAKPAYFSLLEAARALSDQCLDWAGMTYSQYIRPARPVSAQGLGYHYRYYAETRNYAGVRDGKVYYYDPVTMSSPAEVMSLAECQRRAR
jgi:endo-1,4-beta-xylanase